MSNASVFKELREAPMKLVSANIGFATDIAKGRALTDSVSDFVSRLPFAGHVLNDDHDKTEADRAPANATEAPAPVPAQTEQPAAAKSVQTLGVAESDDAPANAEPVDADAAPEGEKVHPQVKLAQKAARIAEKNGMDEPNTPFPKD